jgi:hypothetical protein
MRDFMNNYGMPVCIFLIVIGLLWAVSHIPTAKADDGVSLAARVESLEKSMKEIEKAFTKFVRATGKPGSPTVENNITTFRDWIKDISKEVSSLDDRVKELEK